MPPPRARRVGAVRGPLEPGNESQRNGDADCAGATRTSGDHAAPARAAAGGEPRPKPIRRRLWAIMPPEAVTRPGRTRRSNCRCSRSSSSPAHRPATRAPSAVTHVHADVTGIAAAVEEDQVTGLELVLGDPVESAATGRRTCAAATLPAAFHAYSSGRSSRTRSGPSAPNRYIFPSCAHAVRSAGWPPRRRRRWPGTTRSGRRTAGAATAAEVAGAAASPGRRSSLSISFFFAASSASCAACCAMSSSSAFLSWRYLSTRVGDAAHLVALVAGEQPRAGSASAPCRWPTPAPSSAFSAPIRPFLYAETAIACTRPIAASTCGGQRLQLGLQRVGLGPVRLQLLVDPVVLLDDRVRATRHCASSCASSLRRRSGSA